MVNSNLNLTKDTLILFGGPKVVLCDSSLGLSFHCTVALKGFLLKRGGKSVKGLSLALILA